MNIKDRLAKIHFFEVKPDFSSLDENEKRAISHCIDASDIMTDIYLDQAYGGNKQIYAELQKRSDEEGKNLLKYFLTQGSPWDSYNHDEPFMPWIGDRPKFGSFYPADFGEIEWNNWLYLHPEMRENFESNYTVIKRSNFRENDLRNFPGLNVDNSSLVAVPYSEEFRERLTEVASHLEKAASHLPSGNLRNFLNLRAKAFLTNDYFESDMAWVDTKGDPFEVTIGPYETYFDNLFGLKAAFESFIALPDKDSTEALTRFTPYVPEFDLMLTQEFNFKPKGAAIPLEVVSDVMRGGEGGFGYMFVAYNLPNDRRVHDIKGSKKVFSRTMMEAKFFTRGLPVAERILPSDMVDNCNFDNRLLFVLGHELAHGLGPSKIKSGSREIPFEVALKDLHSSLEEAKADMLGTRLLKHFRNRNLFDDKKLEGIVSTEIVAYFQQWDKGFTEAHSRGNLIEYNWLKENKALKYNKATKKYDINAEKCIEAMSDLSTEFLNLQIAGDYDKAKRFMKQWGSIPEEVPEIIETLSDLPTAVSPIWDLSGLKKR